MKPPLKVVMGNTQILHK